MESADFGQRSDEQVDSLAVYESLYTHDRD